MIYPDEPTGKGITLTKKDTQAFHDDICDLLYHYSLFKGTDTQLTEIKDGTITLEINYPDCLPDVERDRRFILMVVAYVLGKPVLDHIHTLQLVEYESAAIPGFWEFDYLTQEEKNHRVETNMFATVCRQKVGERTYERNELIDLYRFD